MTLFDEKTRIAMPVNRSTTSPRIVLLPLAAPLRVRPCRTAPPPLSSMSGAPAKPSCVVASRTTVLRIDGSTAPVTAIVCAPPPPIEKFDVWTPATAFELRMNWRRRALLHPVGAAPSSSPLLPRLLVIALNENAESTLAALALEDDPRDVVGGR